MVNPVWAGETIEYRHNCYGFRGEDWPVGQPVAASLGCSLTYGVGVHDHQTWSSHLGVTMNISEGGAGQEVCVHYLQTLLQLGHRISVLYYLEPSSSRRYLCDYINGVVTSQSATQSHRLKHVWVRSAMHPKVLTVMQRTTRLAIYALSVRYGFTVSMINVHDQSLTVGGFYDCAARDAAHPGPVAHAWLAKHWHELAHPIEYYLEESANSC